MATPELSGFFAVLRGGNGQEVETLLRDLDPFLRKAIRLRLIDGRLRRTLDTTDILQSLLNDFLSQEVGAPPATGDVGGLCAYLTAAVHHKIRRKARKERRHAGSLPDNWDPASPEPTGTRRIDDADLNQFIRGRLSESNVLLFDLRAQGLTWIEIAAKVGGMPDALRMRLTRAVAAVLAAIGHGELSDAR